MAANVETMFSHREKPWHGLGVIVDNALTSEEALVQAGLDWTVGQQPLIHNGEETGYFLNVRESDNHLLGVVRSRYRPIQNADAFDFVDRLIGTGDVLYETAGSLSTGKRVWMMAKMPDIKIFGDVVEPFMCLTNSHDGFGSLKVIMTPVRVVCQNTLNLALGSAKRSWNIRHVGNIESKVFEAQHTLGLAQQYMDEFRSEATDLQKIKIASGQFEILISKMFPITEEMGKRKEASQLLLRDQLTHAWEMDDLGNIRGTGWGFMNAVSDMSTHRPPARSTANFRENSFTMVLDDPYVLDRAYALVRELV